MNLYEFAEKFDISLRKARLMHEAGVLALDLADDPELSEIRLLLAKSAPLPVLKLCRLATDPQACKALGKYSAKAAEQVAVVGSSPVPAPRPIAALIAEAARKDLQACKALLTWMGATLPSEPVPYAWIGVRLLLGINPANRKAEFRHLRPAMRWVRDLIDREGGPVGYMLDAKGKTYYFRKGS